MVKTISVESILRKLKTDIKIRLKRDERFLLLMPEYVWGGAETQFRLLIAYAEKFNWKLDVIIEHRFKYEDSLLKEDILKMKNVRFYELNEYDVGEEKFLQDIALQIFKGILNTKYKVCLIQYTPDLIIAPFLYCLGIDVIYSERNDASLIKDNFEYQRYLKYCRHIVANSKYAKKVLEKLMQKKVYFIRNGKPVKDALTMKNNREIRNILVPCRVYPIKNQMMVLHYIRDTKNFAGKVIFAGRIENKAYYSKLLHFVERNQLQERVEFLGQVSNMEDLYQTADIVILPSFMEGTPNVVLESYLYCRPIIVSDTATVRDVVKNPLLRFSIKDTMGIDRCIQYIKNLSNEEFKSMLDQNRRYVITNYNVEKMVYSYFKLMSNKSCNKLRKKF